MNSFKKSGTPSASGRKPSEGKQKNEKLPVQLSSILSSELLFLLVKEGSGCI